MPVQHEGWLPRGEAGLRATIAAMGALVKDGIYDSEVRKLAITYQPREIHRFLRSYWTYVPDGENETIRTPEVMALDFKNNGKFFGDCDDAAVMAGAMLLVRLVMPYTRTNALNFDLKSVSFCAVRMARVMEFSHVFIIAEDQEGTFLVDPTAPADADYTAWEKLVIRII